ncbi:MAG TPA: hypothetical protein ENJ62_00255 [Bryobacterales bacterium]|nr:hypothetical protein [Bryobacterales bacterium]
MAGNRLPLSTLPGFRKAYRSDRDAMPDDLRRRMYYFLQPGKSGQQETFAEAFAVALGGGSAVTLQSDFRQAFPRVMAHIRRQLETPRGTVSDASGPPHRRASATPARWRPQPSSGIVAQR